jgi:hypothetical protein
VCVWIPTLLSPPPTPSSPTVLPQPDDFQKFRTRKLVDWSYGREAATPSCGLGDDKGIGYLQLLGEGKGGRIPRRLGHGGQVPGHLSEAPVGAVELPTPAVAGPGTPDPVVLSGLGALALDTRLVDLGAMATDSRQQQQHQH